MKKQHIWALSVIGLLSLLGLNQFLFVAYQAISATSTNVAIENYLALATHDQNRTSLLRAVYQLDALKVIECAVVDEVSSEINTLIDLGQSRKCKNTSAFQLSGIQKDFLMRAELTKAYQVRYKIKNSRSFYVALWTVRLAISFLYIAIVLFGIYFLRTKEIQSALELKKINEISNLAKQLAHDIRSPLASLNMIVAQLNVVPEQQRLLLRNSVNRINDIANSLLLKGKEQKNDLATKSPAGNGTKVNPGLPVRSLPIGTGSGGNEITNGSTSVGPLDLQIVLLPALIDAIVSEKRVQFRDKIGVEIEANLQNSYGAFARICSIEFGRVVSNLLNNAVEGLIGGVGKIEVSVAMQKTSISVSISDNGKGIPAHILVKLGQQGVSHGKNGTSSGSGIGVYHAKKTIEAFGGKFEIVSDESPESHGTTIRMILPMASSPPWFVTKLTLAPGATVVSLDDDLSIHDIYKTRFQDLQIAESGITHLTFSSGSDFINWYHEHNQGLGPDYDCLFLLDFELLNQKQNGLDIIKALNLGAKSILVTSRYDEAGIRQQCEGLNVRLIPKPMAGFVPIEIAPARKQDFTILIDDDVSLVNRPKVTNINTKGASVEKIKYDLCLIDDDWELIQPVWASVAASKGLTIQMFTKPQEFLANANKIDRQTPIYVDVSLGDSISGIDVAYEIHRLGFTEINLATGYQADSMNVPPFIRHVVGKDFPQVG